MHLKYAKMLAIVVHENMNLLPPQGFRPEAKCRGGTPVTRGYILRTVLTVQIYSQYTRKISICSNRGREESVDNDDVSIVCTCKYEMVRMT